MNTPKKSSSKKNWLKAIEILKSPFALGLALTVLCVLIALNFYQTQGQQESVQRELPTIRRLLFEGIRWLDLKNQDGRFLMRGPIEPTPNVALLTIDDLSIEQIGRWPWSREKIAFVIQEMRKYGAKTIGFDIVFSEPQVDQTMEALKRIEVMSAGVLPGTVKAAIESEKSRAQPDAVLAKTLAENKDHVILGAFNDEGVSDTRLLPYQDYCRNEAFRRANAEKFVKADNLTFIVDDAADPFVDLDFSKFFSQMFPAIEAAESRRALKEVFQKPDLKDLNEIEQRQLTFLQQTANMRYCESWLTPQDNYLEASKPAYEFTFKSSKHLAGLPIDQALEKFKNMIKPAPVIQHQRWTINTDQIQENVTYTGSFNAEQDNDGTIRKASMFFRTGNRFGLSFIPSIALQTYLAATGYRADVEINIDPKHPDQKILTKFDIMDPSKDPAELISSVPVDPQGRMYINYAGWKNMYSYLPAKELFNGKETATISRLDWNPETKSWNPKDETVKKADFIKDKSFIFGATAIGVYDLRVTPFDKNFPGPETHVNTLGNLFSKNFLKTHPREQTYMLWAILIFGTLLSFLISHTSAIPGALITLGALGVVMGLDQYFFKLGYLVTMTLPAGVVLVLYIFLFFYKYLTEERKKKELRSTFSKYVSPAVVDEILADAGNIELGGRKQRMTVFFSDLRNFTTISEKLQATELSDVLNLYLTPMTQLVFANKGTLDKYIGDAVMAFFGAPIAFPDHATHACRCALISIAKLKSIREEIDTKFPGKNIPIEIGIGINTADVSVGNMGSDIVRSYTVMGDGVNLASRLEGITKEYGVKIVISEFTYADVKDKFTCRELDWVRVKGKLEPVVIYELISEGKPDSKTEEVLRLYNEGYALYHKKEFSKALELFKKALEINPEDHPTEEYKERCEDYIESPPPENWDGVKVMKTK